MRAFELLQGIAVATLMLALAVPLLKQSGSITVGWGTVIGVSFALLAIGLVSLWILSEMLAAV